MVKAIFVLAPPILYCLPGSHQQSVRKEVSLVSLVVDWDVLFQLHHNTTPLDDSLNAELICPSSTSLTKILDLSGDSDP